MAIEVYISNSLNKVVAVNYRLGTNPMRVVSIQSRAINNKVMFIDQADFDAFKASAQHLFNKGILIEGSTTEKKLVAQNTKLSKETTAMKTAKTDSVVDKLQESADQVNTDLNIEVEKVEKDGKRKKAKS